MHGLRRMPGHRSTAAGNVARLGGGTGKHGKAADIAAEAVQVGSSSIDRGAHEDSMLRA